MRYFALILGIAVASCTLVAQQVPPPPPPPTAAPASVTYAVDAANRDPAHFSLTIDLLGHAVYTARDEDASSGADDSSQPLYRVEFDVSPATRDRVFAAARALDYFHGDFDFRKHVVADTGRKTFTYRDGIQQSATTFNWSENKQLQDAAELFESVALTQALARKLQFLHRYDRLGLNEVLKRMEELARANYLSELQSIAPTLRLIANDASVMHVARERANRLLDQVAASGVPPGH